MSDDLIKSLERFKMPEDIGMDAFMDEVRKLEQDHIEAIKLLIDIRKLMDRLPSYWYSEYRAENIKNYLEQKTGQKWETLKELEL